MRSASLLGLLSSVWCAFVAMGCGGAESVDFFSESATTAGASNAGASGLAGGASTAGRSGSNGGSEPGACSPASELDSGEAFDTLGPFCLRVKGEITGWGCSNFEGRSLRVNGVPTVCAAMPLPPQLKGDYYFEVTAGQFSYAALYWY